ncbi:MAG: hypothetical protein ACRET5_20585 [Steroidobacteraceae bacterium]
MSRDLKSTADFEQRLNAILDEGVRRVGGRARSRLNQARQAALVEAARRGRWSLPLRAASWIRLHLWMPAGGAVAAAALVAFVLWPHPPQGYPAAETNQTSAEDLDLIADRDAMDIVQSGDGQFYEWAMAQAGQGSRTGDTPAGRSRAGGGQSAAPVTDPNPG